MAFLRRPNREPEAPESPAGAVVATTSGGARIRAYVPLGGILSAFFLLQLPSVLNRRPGWDESVYVGIGKYFASGGAAGLYEPIRPPGLPLLTGLAWLVGDPVPISRFVALLGALGLIVTVWWLARELGGLAAANAAALVLVLTPVFEREAVSIMTEVPSALFGTLALAAVLKRRAVLGGVLAAAAFVTRFAAGLFLPVLAVYLGARRDWRGLALLLAGFAIASAPYFLANAWFHGSALGPLVEASRYAANPENAVQGTWENVTYYLVLFLTNPLLILAVAGLSRDTLAVAIAALVPLAFHTWIASKEAIYFILPLPFIAVLAGIGVAGILRAIPGRSARVVGPAVAAIGLALTLAVTLPAIGRELTADRAGGHPDAYAAVAALPGPVLTSDPRVVTVTNKLAIPFYQTHSSVNGDVEFAMHDQNARVALFSLDAFGCGADCDSIVANLQRDFAFGWRPVFSDGRATVYVR
jgi:4-amino-4-deoxy-L-arabinose transferase-like glycosyltransferase